MSVRLVVSVLVSLATVVLSPFTSPKTFITNLLVMHVLLFVPIISSSPETSPAPFSVNLNTLYRIIHLACAAIHVRAITAAVRSLVRLLCLFERGHLISSKRSGGHILWQGYPSFWCKPHQSLSKVDSKPLSASRTHVLRILVNEIPSTILFFCRDRPSCLQIHLELRFKFSRCNSLF